MPSNPTHKRFFSEHSQAFLTASGYLFPSNPEEMVLFRQLQGDIDPAVTGKEVNPFAIIERCRTKTQSLRPMQNKWTSNTLKMVAKGAELRRPKPPETDSTSNPDE